jgi:hypothetical protein
MTRMYASSLHVTNHPHVTQSRQLSSMTSHMSCGCGCMLQPLVPGDCNLLILQLLATSSEAAYLRLHHSMCDSVFSRYQHPCVQLFVFAQCTLSVSVAQPFHDPLLLHPWNPVCPRNMLGAYLQRMQSEGLILHFPTYSVSWPLE